MTQGFNGDGIIEVLLSWFKYLFGGIFGGITGGSGGNFFKLLSGSWKGILVFILILGVTLNLVVYIVRWRPHWWWFAKKRMLVDDEIFEPRKKKTDTVSEAKPKTKPSTMVPKRTEPAKKKKDLFEPEEDVFTVKKRTRR